MAHPTPASSCTVHGMRQWETSWYQRVVGKMTNLRSPCRSWTSQDKKRRWATSSSSWKESCPQHSSSSWAPWDWPRGCTGPACYGDSTWEYYISHECHTSRLLTSGCGRSHQWPCRWGRWMTWARGRSPGRRSSSTGGFCTGPLILHWSDRTCTYQTDSYLGSCVLLLGYSGCTATDYLLAWPRNDLLWRLTSVLTFHHTPDRGNHLRI